MANYISKIKLPNSSTYDIKDSRISVDSNGKIELSNLPDVILGQMVYGGTFVITGTGTTAEVTATLSTNAKTKLRTESSTVQLANSADDGPNTFGWKSNEGIYYICQTSATVWELDFEVGDWLVSTGSSWKKIDNTDAVKSVNGHTGIVVGLEETDNKVTGWSSTPNDTHYPSEKLVKDSLDTKVIEAGTGTGSAVQKSLNNTASGTGAMAVNGETSAHGLYSFAEGYRTDAHGDDSHAEGTQTETGATGAAVIANWRDGYSAHAEGHLTKAQGRASHAEGDNTTTNNIAEHAEGRFNYSHYSSTTYGDASNTQHSIGIGTNISNRKNAVEVMQNGDVYILGVGNYDGSDIDEANTVKEVIDEKINEPSTEGTNGQVLTTDGNGGRSWTTIAAGGASIIEKTYSELVAMRNGGTLQSGQLYRITDYVTTTVQANTNSAGHAFDLIVLATSSSMLDCHAMAETHFNETYFRTNNADLTKWQIWYDINNDTSKYSWADSTNGKGVIYRMIDEWGNDCPYDFKNIRFMVGANTVVGTVDGVYYYTFSVAEDMGDMTVTDHSFNGSVCYGNVIGRYIDNDKLSLNFIVFRNILNSDYCYLNILGNNCFMNVFGQECTYNTLGDYCIVNQFGDYCNANTFGNICIYNVLGNNCSANTFGNNCQYNTFGDSSYQYGNYYKNNIFDNGCSYIKLYNTSTASPSQQLQNIKVSQGVSGTSSSYVEISSIARNLAYQTKVAKNSSGDLKIYCEADLIQ